MNAWNAFDHSAEYEPERRNTWRTVTSIEDYDQHVIPLDDDLEHEALPACACMPKAVEHQVNDTRRFYTVYVHQAYDGRPGPER